MYKKIIIILFCLSEAISADTIEEQMIALKKNTYGFSVCNISEKEKTDKVEKLDAFWQFVDANKPESLTTLRKLLKSEEKDGFFLIDAAALLASKSTEKDDLRITFEALEKGYPCGANQQFFGLANHLSLKGIDTYSLVEKILLEPKFSYFISDHFLTIHKREAAILLLYRLNTNSFAPKLRLFLKKHQSNESLMLVVADLLHMAADVETENFLAEFANTIKNPKTKASFMANLAPVRFDEKYVITLKNLGKKEVENHLETIIMRKYKDITTDIDVLKKDLAYQIRKESIPYLNEAIMKVAKRVSNEGLDELYYLIALRMIAATRE